MTILSEPALIVIILQEQSTREMRMQTLKVGFLKDSKLNTSAEMLKWTNKTGKLDTKLKNVSAKITK